MRSIVLGRVQLDSVYAAQFPLSHMLGWRNFHSGNYFKSVLRRLKFLPHKITNYNPINAYTIVNNPLLVYRHMAMHAIYLLILNCVHHQHIDSVI